MVIENLNNIAYQQGKNPIIRSLKSKIYLKDTIAYNIIVSVVSRVRALRAAQRRITDKSWLVRCERTLRDTTRYIFKFNIRLIPR